MENRREFLKKSLIAGVAVNVAGCVSDRTRPEVAAMTPREPKTALIVWYGQTGHTRRYAEVIGRKFAIEGIRTAVEDIRRIDAESLSDYDLIVMGTPVYYYDVPVNVKAFVRSVGPIAGIPVAVYVTFGGPGGNQHNTACALLSLMMEKGGAPAGMDSFGNMSTYAPTWSMGNEARILKYRHLPDASTYMRVEAFADRILDAVRRGETVPPRTEFSLEDWARYLPVVRASKMVTTGHSINIDRCTGCGTCQSTCPVGAIDPEKGEVNTDRCVACLGCINNCPTGAVEMAYMGKTVYGFKDFLKKHGISIHEPKIS